MSSVPGHREDGRRRTRGAGLAQRGRVARGACVALVTLTACAPDAPVEGPPRLDPATSLAGVPDSGFQRALEPRPFRFPEDHGPHPDFRTEWWYVTANLRTDAGEELGLQFTLFRSALAPPGGDEIPGASPWATRQAYMAHLALADVAAGRFRSWERFGRGAAGIAGAEATPRFRVWLDDWTLSSVQATGPGAGGVFPLALRATTDSVDIDLTLEQGRPLVLQGEDGLSRKGDAPGQASYYYSFTRMPVRGRIRTPRGLLAVDGVAWMDREWSTSVLSDDQEGWDWFALHLPDGRDLMLFELRARGGPPRVDGTLVAPDGGSRAVAPGDVTLDVLERWESPDGAVYPAGWRIRIASADVDVTVRPLLADQELRHAFRYWEGAVAVEDAAGRSGRGYVELTGYAGRPLQR
ncbi:MAG: lipocalin-like domain-containing protein [Gemmatimonadota bacterium]